MLFIAIGQTLHSIEEYVFELWEVFDVARFLSGLFSSNLEVGFLVINSSIVLLAYWSYLLPVRKEWKGVMAVYCFWIVLELGNSIGHIMFSINAGGYFPGIYTAPILLLASLYTAAALVKGKLDSV